MGEYAKRKKDGVEVKIGTCNQLFYLRHDQLSDVEYSYNGMNCFFRIPNPDEDGIEAGDFDNYRVFEKDGCIPLHLRLDESMFSCEEWKNLADWDETWPACKCHLPSWFQAAGIERNSKVLLERQERPFVALVPQAYGERTACRH